MKKIFNYMIIVIAVVFVIGILIPRDETVIGDDIRELYQYINNSNSLAYWTVDEYSTKEGYYINQVFDHLSPTEYANIDAILDPDTDYTFIHEIYYNDDTTLDFYVDGDAFSFQSLNDEVGIYATLVHTESSIADNGLSFFNTSGETGYIGFRVSIFNGDLTDLDEDDLRTLLDDAEFGDYTYEGTTEYIQEMSMTDRIDDVINVMAVVMIVAILGYVGFSNFKF